MEYQGKLYGKVDETYFPLLESTDDFETLQKENDALKNKLGLCTEAKEVLSSLLKIHILEIDSDGEPTANLSEIMETWNRVRELIIKL